MQSLIDPLFIELTNHCNFKCTFCPDDVMKRKRGYMDFGLIEKIFHDLKKNNLVNYVIPSLMGEPLLHPRFFDFLDLAKKNNIKVHLITNGSLITSNEKLEKLFSSSIFELVLSYQTPWENMFHLRKAGNLTLDTYRETLINIICKKFEMKASTAIELHFLDTAERSVRGIDFVNSPEEMLKVIQGWKSIFEEIANKFHLKNRINEYTLREIKKIIRNNILYMTKFEILPDVYMVLKKTVLYGNYLLPEGISVKENPKGKCFAPFKSLAVLWNGDCTFCCEDFNGELIVGNIKDNSLEEIWYGERLNNARKDMHNLILSNKFCQRCKGELYDCNGNRIDLVKKYSFPLQLNHSYLRLLKAYKDYGFTGIFSKKIKKFFKHTT